MVDTLEADFALEKQDSSSGDGSDDSGGTGGNGRIKVWATDSNNQVVSGLTAEILSESGYGDSAEVDDMMGVATFNDVPIEGYSITVLGDGYKTKTKEFDASSFTA